MPNTLDEWKSFKCCLMQINATIMYEILSKSQYFIGVGWKLKSHDRVFGLFRIRLVNYTHSGPIEKNKWVLLFALPFFFFDLMISDLRTLNYNKKNGQSCTIAVLLPGSVVTSQQMLPIRKYKQWYKGFTEPAFPFWTYAAGKNVKMKKKKNKRKKKILYMLSSLLPPVTFNWFSINLLVPALSFENIEIKTMLNKRLFLRYDPISFIVSCLCFSFFLLNCECCVFWSKRIILVFFYIYFFSIFQVICSFRETVFNLEFLHSNALTSHSYRLERFRFSNNNNIVK